MTMFFLSGIFMRQLDDRNSMDYFYTSKKAILLSLSLKILETLGFFVLILGIILMPIVSHGCHSNPHTDDELRYEEFELLSDINFKKKP